jgi:pSer/pThr/pTyr-binding forkhead associated (FHA) protein
VPDAAAYLLRLEPDGRPAPVSPIPLPTPDATIGTDPVQAAIILDEPGIASLHARIQQNLTGAGYLIFDQNSLAGTWVNYEPVTQEGYPLKHGDRVHFGHISYRFELKEPPIISEPVISPADS